MKSSMARSGRWGVVAAMLAVASVALAQAPGQGGRAGPSGMGGGPSGMGARPPADARPLAPNVTELVNMRLSQLEEDLNLRAHQLALWNKYRERVLGLLDDVRRAGRVSAIETTAPQRLDALIDHARNRLTAIEDIADAGKALYAALTPEQKTVADRRLALPLATLSGQDPGDELRTRPAPRATGDAAAPLGGGPRPPN